MRHFIRASRVVDVGGRHFTVSSPTVATVLLAVEAWGGALVALAQDEAAAALTPDELVGVLAPVLAGTDEAQTVLGTCVAWDGGPVTGEEFGAVARAALRLCDAAGIAAWLDLGALASRVSSGETVDPDEADLAYVRVAREFGVAPHEVLGWPVDTFRRTVDVLAAERREQRQQYEQRQGRSVTSVDLLAPANELAARGIRVGEA